MIGEFDIEIYKTKLAKYLSAISPVFTAELIPHPIHWRYTDGDRVTEGNHYCIEIHIASTSVSDKSAEITIQHDEEEFDNSDYHVWGDAYKIQEEYFQKNDLSRGEPGNGNSYWNLWNFLENK